MDFIRNLTEHMVSDEKMEEWLQNVIQEGAQVNRAFNKHYTRKYVTDAVNRGNPEELKSLLREAFGIGYMTCKYRDM